MAKGMVVGGSPSNSIATKSGSKTPGLGKHKGAMKGKKVGNSHGPSVKKM